jgi:hypothetical protein
VQESRHLAPQAGAAYAGWSSEKVMRRIEQTVEADDLLAAAEFRAGSAPGGHSPDTPSTQSQATQ